VSIESGIARDLGVDVGDALTLDVQGMPVECRVSSVREVDWRQVRPNFFLVFPAGGMEAAPATHVLATRVGSPAESARMQREVVREFANVSVVDLALVLDAVERVVSKVALAIQLMALFTVGTGVVVLAGAVATGRWQRVQEAVLLRTLGASRGTVRRILAAEYAGLGLLAGMLGAGMAVGGAWALVHFVFKTGLHIPWVEFLATMAAVPLLTLSVGLLVSRGVGNTPPLQILRNDG
jgi:putative ABC transport system permease protein